MTTLLDRQTHEHSIRKNGMRQPHFVVNPRILCVDDDPDFQTALEMRLRKYEVEIEHAFYGVQGIVEAAEKLPDIILLDQAMPNGSGEYALQIIRRNPAIRNVPVIVLTGMRDSKLRRRLMDAGADAYLQKPVAFTDLVKQISRFVNLQERKS